MDKTYSDSFEALQEEISKLRPASPGFKTAKAVIDLKSIVESKRNTESLIKATWVLAALTALLFLATGAYAIIAYMNYVGSEKQALALDALTAAVTKMPIPDLIEAVDRLPIADLSQAVIDLPITERRFKLMDNAQAEPEGRRKKGKSR